ncbi:MAG: NUDIX hydrolase [Christensenellales bacterium]|jgi:8-oxo-dGTP diphosphatase
MKLSNEDEKFLQTYSSEIYEKPSLTVDAVVLRLFDKEEDNYRKLPEKKLQVFLSERKNSPFKNTFAIVGSFINLENELSDSVRKCVKDKIDLKSYYLEQLYTFGETSRDPRTRVVSVSYLLLTNKQQNLKNGEWFDIELTKRSTSLKNNHFVANYDLILKNDNLTLTNEIEVDFDAENNINPKKITLKNSSLAFDHAKIIFYALMRLRNKLDYTDIIFNLLPEKFTLTELKKSYEVILNEKLLDANFRRKTSSKVKPTDEFTKEKGHRPSQIFVKNNNRSVVDLD